MFQELNRRWPFIVGAREDERCPGLLLVECTSNVTIAQIPDLIRLQDINSSNLNIRENQDTQGNSYNYIIIFLVIISIVQEVRCLVLKKR